MVAQEETRRAESSEGGVDGNGAGDPGIGALFEHARSELSSLFVSLRRVAFLEWQSLQLRAIDAFFRVGFFICAVAFGLAASISAARLLVSGFRGAFQSLGASPWVCDLGGSAVALMLIFPGGILVRAILRKQLVKKVERRLEIPPKPAGEVQR